MHRPPARPEHGVGATRRRAAAAPRRYAPCPRALRLKFTLPSISAKIVWSRPRPTLLPGCHLVPRWRTRMLPATTLLAAGLLDAEAAAFRIAPVAGRAACLFMCHGGLLLCFFDRFGGLAGDDGEGFGRVQRRRRDGVGLGFGRLRLERAGSRPAAASNGRGLDRRGLGRLSLERLGLDRLRIDRGRLGLASTSGPSR